MQELGHIVGAGISPGHEDQRLISEVLRKDRKATAEFVARCTDYVYPFVYHRVMPRTEVVEDLTQEILLAAWQSLLNFRGDSDLRAWLLGIARHKIEDYYRKRIREAESQEDEDAAPEPAVTPMLEQKLDEAVQRQRVETTLGLLPEAYALALVWRYREEKSVREMAELTGKIEKAMERLLARARENFKKRWDDGQP